MRAAVALLCALGAARGSAQVFAASTPDEKSVQWVAGLRRSLMHDNYDYPAGGPRRAAPRYESAEPAADAVYQSYDEARDGPASPKMTPTVPDVRDPRLAPASTRGREHATRGPVNELREDYADAVPGEGNKYAGRAEPYGSSPDRPADEALDEYSAPAAGRAANEPPEELSARAPDAAISRQDLYGPVERVVTENGSLTDEEFEARRHAFLESLYELEDQLRPVYLPADRGSDVIEARRGVSGRGGRAGDKYQYAELPGLHPSRGRDAPVRLPPRQHRGRRDRPRGEDRRHIEPRDVKVQSATPFVDPRDGIRRYKVHTNVGRSHSNGFDARPRHPQAWDGDDRPSNGNGRNSNGRNEAPNRDDRLPTRHARDRRNRPRNVAAAPRPPPRSSRPIPAARHDEDGDEPLYRDADSAKSGPGGKPRYSDVWRDDWSSHEERRPASHAKRHDLTPGPEYVIERRARPGRPAAGATGSPQRLASRRLAELLAEPALAESTCDCHNTTRTARLQTTRAAAKPLK